MSIDHGCSSILAAMVARDCPTHVLVNRKVKADLRVASPRRVRHRNRRHLHSREGWSLGGPSHLERCGPTAVECPH